MDIIYKPFGWALGALYAVFGNYAYACFFFTLIINLIFIPLNFRQQKTSAKQARLRPKMEMLKKKYGDDRVKLNEETQKLYQREGVGMLGGCLTMLIRLPFLWGVYNAIQSPLTSIANLGTDVIDKAKEILAPILGVDTGAVTQLQIVNNLDKVTGSVPEFANAASLLNFDFLGLNLAETPHFSWNIIRDFQMIWIIPILALVTSLLQSIVSMMVQKRVNPEAGGGSMMSMMLIMPLFSLFIAFSVPGAVGFYWACSSLVSGVISTLVQVLYSTDKINAKNEVVMARKRMEYENSKKQRANMSY